VSGFAVKLIVGLGNPGPRYARTRHNIGARVVRALAAELGIALTEREELFGRLGAGQLGDVPIAILLPDTWMNASGGSVAPAVTALGLDDVSRDLIVAADDVDLPFGRMRVRARGSDGGQRGLRDVLAVLAREDVPRLRIGVGRAAEPGRDTKEYVLDAFSAAEEALLPDLTRRAVEALKCFAEHGAAEAANRFNGLPPLLPP
jgi:PTH1 family peptidyl-tRNA hydrolase